MEDGEELEKIPCYPDEGGTGVGSVEGVEPMPWIVHRVEFIFKTIHD